MELNWPRLVFIERIHKSVFIHSLYCQNAKTTMNFVAYFLAVWSLYYCLLFMLVIPENLEMEKL